MPTVKRVRAILSPFSDAKVTKAKEAPGHVHVQGFVTTPDLKVLVERYDVFMHSDGGILCVGE